MVQESHSCTVHMPPIDINLDEENVQILSAIINPLSESEVQGIDLYEQTVRIINELISRN